MFVGAGSYMVITFAAIMCVGDVFGNASRWPYFPLVNVLYIHFKIINHSGRYSTRPAANAHIPLFPCVAEISVLGS